MISSPPEIDDALAWPVAAVFRNGFFQGYLMKKLDYKNYRPWLEVAHSSTRRKKAPDFTVQYALYSSRNLAEALSVVHEAGHIIGDVNESNIFVSSQAEVMIVDTDSAQISSRSGKVYPCIVGKPEYTAPEISHGSLREHKRTPQTDSFAFGVAFFQILTGGAHPCDGIYTLDDDPPSTVEKIRKGVYPGLGKGGKSFRPVPRVASSGIPSRILSLIAGLLATNPSSRVGIDEAIDTIDDVLDNLTKCRKVNTHFYDKRDGKCGWCLHAQKHPDPWSNSAPKPSQKKRKSNQKSLPGVSFKDEKEVPKRAPRSRVNTAAANTNQPGGHRTAQNTGGSSQSSQYSQQQRVQQRPQKPQLIKGKLAVEYVDGTYGQRPSYSSLISAGKWNIVKRAIGAEYPGILKFWWPERRKAPSVIGLLIGLVLMAIGPVAWWYGGEYAKDYLVGKPDIILTIVYYLSLACIVSGAVFSIVTLILTTIACISQKRRNLQSESFFLTAIRFPIISVVYGVIPVAAVVYLLVFIIQKIADSYVANTSRR